MKKVIMVLIGLMLLSDVAMSQEKTEKNSSLSGRIWNIETGEPADFAVLILVDSTGVQRYGASTNENGEYKIEGITPAKYTLKFSCLGYDNIDIIIDIKDEEETLSFGMKFRSFRIG